MFPTDAIGKDYLFTAIGNAKVRHEKITGRKALSLGIGDCTLPIPEIAAKAMKTASDELKTESGFRGYSKSTGYNFLKEKIIFEYSLKGVKIDKDEIFINDGAKSELLRLAVLFSGGKRALVPCPVYPVYENTAKICKNSVAYLFGNEKNGFLPDDIIPSDVIYICSPNNPTGEVYSENSLKKLFKKAAEYNSAIVFDGAYTCFINGNLFETVYNIENSRERVIEVHSFSKSASFTGVRCGFTVIPKENPLNASLKLLYDTGFNGVSYITQRGAEALFLEKGKESVRKNVEKVLENSKYIKNELSKISERVYGGEKSPYVFAKTPRGMNSEDFFRYLLDKYSVIAVYGSGFGKGGENYMRYSAFGSPETVKECVKRIISAYSRLAL